MEVSSLARRARTPTPPPSADAYRTEHRLRRVQHRYEALARGAMRRSPQGGDQSRRSTIRCCASSGSHSDWDNLVPPDLEGSSDSNVWFCQYSQASHLSRRVYLKLPGGRHRRTRIRATLSASRVHCPIDLRTSCCHFLGPRPQLRVRCPQFGGCLSMASMPGTWPGSSASRRRDSARRRARPMRGSGHSTPGRDPKLPTHSRFSRIGSGPCASNTSSCPLASGSASTARHRRTRAVAWSLSRIACSPLRRWLSRRIAQGAAARSRWHWRYHPGRY